MRAILTAPLTNKTKHHEKEKNHRKNELPTFWYRSDIHQRNRGCRKQKKNQSI